LSFDLDLAARRALVTGGTKGVGAAGVERSAMLKHRW
jgi:NAD(P)-dependent dehydrogenase (short-subunit alcohol dehydrogenase family)